MSGRHDIVSGSLRRRCAQDRRLHLHKSHFRHFFTKIPDHIGTEDHIVHHLAVAKVKETIFKAQILSDFLGCCNLKRQLPVHLSKHLHAVRFQLNGSCGNLGIVGLLIPFFNFTCNADTVFLINSF